MLITQNLVQNLKIQRLFHLINYNKDTYTWKKSIKYLYFIVSLVGTRILKNGWFGHIVYPAVLKVSQMVPRWDQLWQTRHYLKRKSWPTVSITGSCYVTYLQH